MRFFELLVANYVGQFIVAISALYIIYTLLNKKIRLTKHLMLFYPIVMLCYVLLIMAVIYPEVQKYGGFGVEIHIVTKILGLIVLFSISVYLLGKKLAGKIFNSLPITLAIQMMSNSLLLSLIDSFTNLTVFWWYVIGTSLTCVMAILFLFLVSKTKLINYCREMIEPSHVSFIITSIYLVASLVLEYNTLHEDNSISFNEAMLVLAVGYIILFFSIAIFSREFFNKRERKQLELLLLQHQLYTNRLENIQQDLRLFQHDYKNMVAGLYAQADAGNTQAVKDYINGKILNINDDVQNDIRQTNQLVKITNMELRGLLLVKLIEAKKADVTIDLEVLYEVGRITIDTSDLMRIMGILLDNAIEEAQTTVMKNVSVIILQEDDKMAIMVKNDICTSVDMSNIWKSGYSTKGKNRGLGLSSYQKILNNYDNTFCETKIEDKQFIQILVIT